MRKRIAPVAVTVALAWVSLPAPTVAAYDWVVAGGGDKYRSGYNPEEPPPYFASQPVAQPNPEWVTKLSDLPSGVFPMGGLIVAEGKVIVGGASTNSLVALDRDTGLPVWRFQPDPRGSRTFAGDGSSGAYPGTNAPWYHRGVVYATFSNGTLYAIRASNGEKIWRFEVPDPGVPGEVTDRTLPPDVAWDSHKPAHVRAPLRQELPPYTGDYAKFHSAVSYCDGKVYVETLDARLYAVNASDGSVAWHRYVGAPDWPGEFEWPEQSEGGIVASSGRSTRRFEAQPGPGCLDQHVFVPTEDGFVKTFDKDTGAFIRAYSAFHPGDLGYAHDGSAGLADPRSGDIIINFLNNRVVRLSVPGMRPRWSRMEDGGTISVCSDRSDRESCSVLTTTEDGQQDGPLGGAVFGGNLGLDYDHRVVVDPNQDGHLYIWKDIDVQGDHPTLVAAVPAGKNPLAKRNPSRDSTSFYLPDDGKRGPWVHRTAVLSSPVLAGGVAYFNASWEHAIYGVQYLDGLGRILSEPRVVFRYEATWDDQFRYPPFGDRFEEPIVDIDLITFGSPAIADGRLYTQANDGSIYAFNLRQPVADTQRNLALLGSGLVPFIPKWADPRGTFDRVWTPADWYKNQDDPNGFRLPAPAGVGLGLGLPGLVLALALRRRTRGLDASASRRRRPAAPRRGHWWP